MVTGRGQLKCMERYPLHCHFVHSEDRFPLWVPPQSNHGQKKTLFVLVVPLPCLDRVPYCGRCRCHTSTADWIATAPAVAPSYITFAASIPEASQRESSVIA
jgi:hypothetical protein